MVQDLDKNRAADKFDYEKVGNISHSFTMYSRVETSTGISPANSSCYKKAKLASEKS